ncbi:Kae1-associated serine/threonine protein kinase [Candidatus Woesearchaeota archaeon]|jgi:Kae1-associated kinase Bud32|nr:Kae1-associated serine/threonine protein kinase [Candidatus Woesearchaeota archaeon]MBT4110766.1 Kae1-associated serine/threonine protein kinase [Candidatus Woesearchaeota archaeon]MBT4336722.1 Kae1-associated serine/threonine protein kinase [Candidatus Woesearchaeota archaeon]MBT4469529.1 Kae1-associated serine/threonine protein kinase [Candidatus Woesearchaeota archaeon]MBT6743891.1 Kae1-associated serine/threonine protein kinase [Candidatus Woesearchaeota archaeon]
MIKIGQGAEAVVYKDGSKVMKERVSKNYRLPQIDDSLRKFRTRREAKVLSKLQDMKFPAPGLLNFCDKRMQITMDFVPGEKLRDVLIAGDEYQQFAEEVGKKIGVLHAHDIIHGDLTTSNMIKDKEIKFIDFGLSSFSDKVEDKAVDLFLLDRALESKHYQHYPEIFDKVLEGYGKSNPDAKFVLERFQAVKKRGRNKNK